MDPKWMFLIVIGMFYLVPTMMILTGIFSVIWPRMAWSLRVARGIRGIEPTTAALVMTRLGGICACLFAAAFLFAVTRLFPIAAGPAAPPPAPAAPVLPRS